MATIVPSNSSHSTGIHQPSFNTWTLSPTLYLGALFSIVASMFSASSCSTCCYISTIERPSKYLSTADTDAALGLRKDALIHPVAALMDQATSGYLILARDAPAVADAATPSLSGILSSHRPGKCLWLLACHS